MVLPSPLRALGDSLRAWYGENPGFSVPASKGCEFNGFMTLAHEIMITVPSPPSPRCLPRPALQRLCGFFRHGVPAIRRMDVGYEVSLGGLHGGQ